MTNENSTLWARLQSLGNLVNILFARIAALEARCAALEQSLNQRWFG